MNHVFDLENLPVPRAVASLQTLALWSMRQALDMHEDERMPTKAIEFWLPLTGRRGVRRWTKLPWRFPAIGRRAKTRRWSSKQFRQALRSPGAEMPDFFYSLSASTAWTDPAFELDVWEAVRGWLSQEMVFGKDLEEHLGFSPYTFWALIAVTLQKEVASTQGVFTFWRSRKTRRVAQAFERIASHRVRYAKEWAGFWDQWLLSKAFADLEVTDMDDWMMRLREMPFTRHVRGEAPYDAKTKVSLRPYATNWSADAPDRLLAFYGYETRPPPLPVRASV